MTAAVETAIGGRSETYISSIALRGARIVSTGAS